MQWDQLMASNIHLFIIGVFPFIFSTQSFGQGFGFPNPSRNVPIEIQADNGIEWHKKTKTYIAHGNAHAKQGEVSIFADQLTAFFRQNKIGFNAKRSNDDSSDAINRIFSPEFRNRIDSIIHLAANLIIGEGQKKPKKKYKKNVLGTKK